MRQLTVFIVLLIGSASMSAYGQPVIDVHLHVRNPDGQLTDFDVILKYMRDYDVVVGLLHDTPENVEALRSRDPDRFLVLPRLLVPQNDRPLVALSEFDNRLSSGEWSGIGEIGTVYFGMHPDDAVLQPYYRLANRLALPVFWHSGARGGRSEPGFRASLGRPLNWENVLIEHRDLKPVLMHAGVPFLDEMLAMLTVYDVYVDTGVAAHAWPSERFYSYFGEIVEAGFADRILYGTDQLGRPENIARGIERVRNAPWEESVKRAILYDNASRFLGLSDRQIRAHHSR